MSWEQAVRCADTALLGAKRSGRNAWLGLVAVKGNQPEDLRPLSDAPVEGWISDAGLEIARGAAAQGIQRPVQPPPRALTSTTLASRRACARRRSCSSASNSTRCASSTSR